MFTVPFTQLTPPGKGAPGFSTEASDIGLAVGEWPDFIAVMRDEHEGALFQRATVNARFAEYFTRAGVLLTVFND